MTPKTLAAFNIIAVFKAPFFHVHASEDPTRPIVCTPQKLEETALKLAERRGYAKGLADCRRRVIDRLLGEQDC